MPKSTTAPSVDSHRFNRDSGVQINSTRPSSFILFTSRIALLQKFSYVEMIPIPFGTTHIWLLRVLVILRYVVFFVYLDISAVSYFLRGSIIFCVVKNKTSNPSAIMITINNSSVYISEDVNS